ncbi:excinuclease ABC subunit A, partial [Burkholderia multivorans]
FSEHMSCPNEHPLTIDEIEPRTFSFNSPFGACPTCDGIGTRLQVDESLVVPDEDLSLGAGAIAPWSGGKQVTKYFNRLLTGLGNELGFTLKTPWKDLTSAQRTAILTGKDYEVHVKYKNRFGRERTYSTGFEGVFQYIQRKHDETESDWSRERYESYMR